MIYEHIHTNIVKRGKEMSFVEKIVKLNEERYGLDFIDI